LEFGALGPCSSICALKKTPGCLSRASDASVRAPVVYSRHSSPTITLQYADRAKAIQLKAKKNEQMTEVGKLKQEIDELKALLAAAHAAGGGGAGLDAEAEARMRRDMEALQAMQQSSFEEKERIAREMEQVR